MPRRAFRRASGLPYPVPNMPLTIFLIRPNMTRNTASIAPAWITMAKAFGSGFFLGSRGQSQELLDDVEVTGGADREELGQALDQPEERSLAGAHGRADRLQRKQGRCRR